MLVIRVLKLARYTVLATPISCKFLSLLRAVRVKIYLASLEEEVMSNYGKKVFGDRKRRAKEPTNHLSCTLKQATSTCIIKFSKEKEC